MLKIEKKHVKIISVTIAVFFLLGVVGIAVSQSGTTYAASASNIGVINYQQVMTQHPDFATAQQTMNAEVEQAKKDFEAKAATLDDKGKQDYYAQLQQRLNGKNQELMAALDVKVKEVVKKVSESKGLAVVVDKNAVVFGGQDITEDVLKKIAGK